MKVSSGKVADPFKGLSRVREARKEKVKTLLPSAFYLEGVKGYSWCDACNIEEINITNGFVVTCKQGHTRRLRKWFPIEALTSQTKAFKLRRDNRMLVMF